MAEISYYKELPLNYADSIQLKASFDTLRRALMDGDYQQIRRMSKEKTYWCFSLRELVHYPVALPVWSISIPAPQWFNKEALMGMFSDDLNMRCNDSAYIVTYKTSRMSKWDLITTKHCFLFARQNQQFILTGYTTECGGVYRFYPDINAIHTYFPKSGKKGVNGWKPGYFSNINNIIYSDILEKFREPVLYNYSGPKEIYRFLWIRSFHEPVSVRISRQGYEVEIVSKMIQYSDDEYPVETIIEKTNTISTYEWFDFRNILDSAGFSTMPVSDYSNQGNDGAMWVLEGISERGSYHYTERWSPRATEFGRACTFLLKKSGLDIKEALIY